MVANDFNTRKEFKANRSGAYKAACELGVLSDICSHMSTTQTTWTYEAIVEEAKKYESRTAFCKGSVGAYEAAMRLKIMDELLPRRKPRETAYTDDVLIREASKYNSRIDFKRNAPKVYSAATRLRKLDLICAHMEPLVNSQWTSASLLKEAQKCNTRTEFATNSHGAYLAAHRLGLLDNICTHMELHNTTNFMFDVDTMLKGVYLLYQENTLIYIGKSNTCIRGRLVTHSKDKQFDKIDILLLENEADVDVLELYLINKYNPPLNKDSNSGSTLTLKLLDEESLMAKIKTYTKRTNNE